VVAAELASDKVVAKVKVFALAVFNAF